jgi:hypothetical protein
MTEFSNAITRNARLVRGDKLSAEQLGVSKMPMITEEGTPADLDNPAISSIANDVLNAARLTLTAAMDAPEGMLGETAEGDVAKAYLNLPSVKNRRGEVREIAASMLNADRKAMEPIFGRALQEPNGAISGGKVRDVLGKFDGGVERIADRMDFKIDPTHLGMRAPSFELPMNLTGMRFENGNLVVPREALGGVQFEGDDVDFEAMSEKMTANEAAALADGVIDEAAFADIWGETSSEDPVPPSEFEAVTDRLRLELVRLRCVDETGNSFVEWFGDDKMAIAGISTDEDGQTKKIPPRTIGWFKDGRSRTLNWNYETFNLREGAHFPKRYGVTFLLAEVDFGGLSDALQRLWNAVKGAVSAAIAKAAKAAGVAIATFLGIPAAAGVIATVIAKATDWIINALMGWIINAFKDDIFKPQTAWLTIPSLSARWNYPNGRWGSTVSPLIRRRFVGHEGIYDLYYRWRLMS